jgi:hypothetical protein
MKRAASRTTSRSKKPAGGGAAGARGSRWIPWVVWVVVLTDLVLVLLRILQLGYCPGDDALHYAAKAVSGKPWAEILVLQANYAPEQNPGWLTLQEWVYRCLGCSPAVLVTLSVISMMGLVNAAALPWLRRPEAWLGALLVVAALAPDFVPRMLSGRPLVATMSLNIGLLFLWMRPGLERPPPTVVVATILAWAVGAWLHSSWFLYAFPVAAFILAGGWHRAVWFTGCCGAGTLLGALFTGHPSYYLPYVTEKLFRVFGGHSVPEQLVVELRPSGGAGLAVLGVVAVLFWRGLAIGRKPRELLNPALMLGGLGWVAGLGVVRCWWDWGAPALAVWLALELQHQFERYLHFASGKRVLAATALAVGVYLAVAGNFQQRWSASANCNFLRQDDARLAGWLPEKDGILYSADMDVFYLTFFANPSAPWRYVLGFESTVMQPEDLAVLRRVHAAGGDSRAYLPWVKKMRLPDRLIIRAATLPSPGPPDIPELEWALGFDDYWLGRLRRGAGGSTGQPPGG